MNSVHRFFLTYGDGLQLPTSRKKTKLESYLKIWMRNLYTKSHLKNRILVQDQGGAEFQPAGILKYFEELRRGPNIEIEPKNFFEIAFKLKQ